MPITNEELEAIAEAVTMSMLEAPDGAEVVLREPSGRGYQALLPGVPREGEVVWHSLRPNAKPLRFIVERVEWSTGRHGNVEVILKSAPL